RIFPRRSSTKSLLAGVAMSRSRLASTLREVSSDLSLVISSPGSGVLARISSAMNFRRVASPPRARYFFSRFSTRPRIKVSKGSRVAMDAKKWRPRGHSLPWKRLACLREVDVAREVREAYVGSDASAVIEDGISQFAEAEAS